jgi:hypothetical protein
MFIAILPTPPHAASEPAPGQWVDLALTRTIHT